ncbi:unnamed protein product [Spirodela intermedia]|uniref:Uncharacterized protein n=1 Tax=Spirodela intermedia TaxID=51605 RepID=A0A7I8L396_SPIIN|nr:unnamed protein product [Spirodela intermedia]
MESAMEMPECPVCLQVYDGEEAIPRVLSCGHSVCSPCIGLLSSSSMARSFPDTIRCPACNQVVPFPSGQGPSALPKNIDLLRLCSSSPSSRQVHSRPREMKDAEFLPLPWDDQFFASWKDLIVPADAISITAPFDSGTDAVSGTLTRDYTCGRSRRFRENQTVRLLAVGAYFSSYPSLSAEAGSGQFKLSSTARVMEALSKLTEKERAELHLIVAAPSRQRHGLCRVLGLWMSSEENSPLFLVGEAFQFGLSRAPDGNEEMGLVNPDDVFGFAKVSMEFCEAMVGLHSQGIACGCLTPSCFRFDSYGHCSLDMNEVLLACRRVRMDVAEATSSSNQCFVSPELRKELLLNKPDPSCGSGVAYGSDVWSLACILIMLIVGEGQHCTLWDDFTVNDSVELNYDLYDIWLKKLTSKLKSSLQGTRFESLLPILESCLNHDPKNRPGVEDMWRCLMSLSIRSIYTVPAGSETLAAKDLLCCLVLGDLCRVPKSGDHPCVKERKILKGAKMTVDDLSGLPLETSCGQDVEHSQQDETDRLLDKRFHGAGLQSVSLSGHKDCITGLAEGGGFLFSCSFDKTVHVWSLQDFSLVRTLRGPEHKLMAVVAVNPAGKPMCIAGDSGGGLCAWDVSISDTEEEEPMRRWHHHNDWRYSGVHSLAASESQFLYSGGGDRSIKAWSLQDFSLACTLTGHKSAVSCLAASEGILFSGSWDGTIRLWWLHDHTPLAVLEDGGLPKGTSVLSLSVSVAGRLLAASYDTGAIKVWRDGRLLKSAQVLDGAIFSVDVDGRWVFAGGWDRTVQVQELSENDGFEAELRPVGSIPSDSVVTSILHWRGRLFVGGSSRDVKVYYYCQESGEGDNDSC